MLPRPRTATSADAKAKRIFMLDGPRNARAGCAKRDLVRAGDDL
jgi:hypothetical protein